MYTKPDKGWLCARTAFVCRIFLMWACVTYFFMCVLVCACIAACDLLSTSYPLASSWPGAFPANQVWVCCQQVSSAHCEIHHSDGAHRTARQQHLSLFLSLPFYSLSPSTAQTQTHENHVSVTLFTAEATDAHVEEEKHRLLPARSHDDLWRSNKMWLCHFMTLTLFKYKIDFLPGSNIFEYNPLTEVISQAT